MDDTIAHADLKTGNTIYDPVLGITRTVQVVTPIKGNKWSVQFADGGTIVHPGHYQWKRG